MSKRTKTNKPRIADIIQLFCTFPKQGYDELISSSCYFNDRFEIFWKEFEKLDLNNLIKQLPDAIDVFTKVKWLKLYHELSEFYKKERKNNIDELVNLNPDQTSLVKALFLNLELEESSAQPNDFPKYTAESLKSIKILLKDILPSLKVENKTSHTRELFELANHLIKIQVDMILLERFLDVFVWADFEMIKKENDKGFILQLPNNLAKIENLYILNELKREVQRNFKRVASHPKISEEEHFKKVDPVFKTNEGLALILHSNNMILTNKTSGTTSLQLKDDTLFTDLTSDDPKKRDEASLNLLILIQEQNFHYRFRNAISQIYDPNDEVNIHDLRLELQPNVNVSLYDLICAMSCLIARADMFRYFGEMPNGSIKTIKSNFVSYHKLKNPELTTEYLEEFANYVIIEKLHEIENLEATITFHFFDEEIILSWLKKIDELKSKSELELKTMIDLITDINSPLPFNPLYKIEGKFYFPYATCLKVDLNRMLYDHYISDKLFNSYQKEQNEKQLIGKTQKNRETRFTNSLKDLFKTITPYAESGLEFSRTNLTNGLKALNGEFDVIAYFEKENIILPIQVKLSNVSPRSEKRKKEWILQQLQTKGVAQVKKDLEFLYSDFGLKFVSDKFKTKNEIKEPRIYPLIVSDNFFADHVSMPFNENGECVICVSYLELEHIILNEKVHDKQTNILPLEKNNAASQLIEMIEKNLFWDFLKPIAENFTFSQSLTAVIDDFKIEMKI
jgi:hypothetical protein